MNPAPPPDLVEAVLSAVALISWPGTTRVTRGADTTLRGDLAMDPLALLSLACELDEAFGIELPDDEVTEWQTIADVAATLASLGCQAKDAAA